MRMSDWANADEPTKRKLAEEALAKTQFIPARGWPQRMTQDQSAIAEIKAVKAELIAAFPRFDWGEPVAPGGRLAHIKGTQDTCAISLNASRLGYRFQCTNSGSLFLESQPAGEYSPTLADAIAALRQTKAEQMRALELLDAIEPED